jgi:glycosyltransferase involved in cell wall biosynthesis
MALCTWSRWGVPGHEADTLESYIEKAQRALCAHHISGEIIVADNGSTDGSQTIAARMGARVVHVRARGHGNALMGGIAAARGKCIIMGDADDSYKFMEFATEMIIKASLYGVKIGGFPWLRIRTDTNVDIRIAL